MGTSLPINELDNCCGSVVVSCCCEMLVDQTWDSSGTQSMGTSLPITELDNCCGSVVVSCCCEMLVDQTWDSSGTQSMGNIHY
jgi:hypothetical protein